MLNTSQKFMAIKSTSTFFFVINENLSSGLLQSQFINPIRSNFGSSTIIINICKLGQSYKAKDIKVINIPFAIPYRFFLYNRLHVLIPILGRFYSSLLSFHIPNGSNVFARSYFPSYVTFLLKEKKREIKYIFDSRSMFVQESVTAGLIKKNARIFRFWIDIEKKILNHAYKVIAVSKSHKEYYQSIDNKVDVELIPCYATPTNPLTSEQQKDIQRKYDLDTNKIHIVYFGSLNNGWNNVDLYSSFFNECRSYDYNCIVISQDFKNLRKNTALVSSGVNIIDTSKATSTELMQIIQCCDYGVVVMNQTDDWESRLSVKFVEYLNSGIKVIVGQYVGEAARYCKTYFNEASIIYKNSSDIEALSKKKVTYEGLIKELFGYKNLMKVFK